MLDAIRNLWNWIYNLFPNLAQVLASFLRGTGLPGWGVDLLMALLSALVVVISVLLGMLGMTLMERKVMGRMQNRLGPNRVGPLGILQPLADAIKFLIKEDIVPTNADRWVHTLAPIVAAIPAVLVYAVIPFGKGMAAADLNIGVLYILAVSSITTIGVVMAGWASNNKYSLLGGMRAAAQIISYEVPLVLSMLVAVMLAGSMSLGKIVEAQGGLGGIFGWNVFRFPFGPLAFLTYMICAVAELNRTPFDLPEGESEIVAGYITEYSGLKWGLFYLGEYFNAIAVSAIATTLFLGGWQGPILPPYVWFLGKLLVIVFILIWLRATLPRFRVDQLMGFAWKVLLPITLVNIFVTGAAITLWQTFVK